MAGSDPRFVHGLGGTVVSSVKGKLFFGGAAVVAICSDYLA